MFKKDSTAHRVKDFIVSDRFFNIYEDAESKILWTDVDKSHNHLKYYLSDNYIPHSDKKGLLGFLYNFSQRIMFVYKRIILSNQLKESRSVLDYGSGDGKFAKYYKNHWAAWDVPRHLYHFNHKSLLNFMSSYGLSFVFKRPLTLDSYYVSYLSEKYKNAPFPLFSGFIIGFLSNCLALFTSNFSSSVYVFRKN